MTDRNAIADIVESYTDIMSPETARKVAERIRMLPGYTDRNAIRAEALEEAATKVRNALEDWAHDLAVTRDQYIDAQTSLRVNGRRITKEMARHFAHDFGERSSAVDGCVEIAVKALAALKQEGASEALPEARSADHSSSSSPPQRMREALEKIERWEMPPTDSFWDKERTKPMSYGAAFGSNGERDVIRSIARAALFGSGKEG